MPSLASKVAGLAGAGSSELGKETQDLIGLETSSAVDLPGGNSIQTWQLQLLFPYLPVSEYAGLIRWLNGTGPPPPTLQAQGGTTPQAATPAAQQPAAGTAGVATGTGNANSAAVAGIVQAARELGVDPRLALSIAQEETNGSFDPNIVGDQGCSIGVFQLNTCTGEGVGVPDYVLHDPYLNAKIALQQVVAVQKQHPEYTPGQIAAAAQRPADPTGYASAVNGFFDQAQTGQGTFGTWAGPYLQQTTAGGLGTSTLQPGRSGTVPQPFPSNYFQDISQSFGQNGEEGTDFAMPEHVEITTPVGGTIRTVDDGNKNWGRAVYVQMPNGWTFFVGHLFDFAVQDGQQVAPGQILGTSGGGKDAPSPGNSQGPHVEIRFIDPQGGNVDPLPILNQVFQGVSYGNWQNGLFLGSSQVSPSEATQDLHLTPDQRLVDYSSQLGAWYQQVNNVWQSVYGVRAPLQAAVDFQNAGINTVAGVQQAVNLMPSQIPGLTIGNYANLRNAADKQAQTVYGRPVPDSLLAQFAAEGIETADDIALWMNGHPSSEIPQTDYQQIFDAAKPYTQAVYNDVPAPQDVYNVWQQSGGYLQTAPTVPPVPSSSLPPSEQIAKTISDTAAGVF